MKIVFLDSGTSDLGDIDYSQLDACGDVTKYTYSRVEEGHDRAREADIVIVNKYKVTKEVLSHWTKCKYICVAATGYNNIDQEACRSASVQVSNVKGYSTASVVQHVFASIMLWTNKLHHYASEVRAGRWHNQEDFCFLDHSIPTCSELSLGVVGMGNIGSEVAKMGLSWGMKVYCIAKYEDQVLKGCHHVDIDSMWSYADIISLHVPLNQDTQYIIDHRSLSMMKPSALLINTGRGGLVNTNDLVAHLKRHTTFNAMLDVLEEEPPKVKSQLFDLPNCTITPHIAWASRQARQQLIDGIASNIRGFLNGTTQNIVVA